MPELQRLLVLLCTCGLVLALIFQGAAELSYAVFGAVLIYAATRPERWSLFLLPVLTALFAFACNLFSPPGIPGTAILAESVGYACITLLACSTSLRAGLRRQERLYDLGAALVIPCGLVITSWALTAAAPWFPRTYDHTLRQIDAAFGVDLNQVIGSWFNDSRVVNAVCQIVYDGLPLILSAVLACARRRHHGGAFVLAIAATGAVGFALYQIVPAAGPRFVDGAGETDATAARNAIPSLHMAWIVLAAWEARLYGRWLTASILACVAITALATLGSGQHYAIDLVVALPFTLAVVGLVQRNGRAAVAGATLVITWLAVIRLTSAPSTIPSAAWVLASLLTMIGTWAAWPRSQWLPVTSGSLAQT